MTVRDRRDAGSTAQCRQIAAQGVGDRFGDAGEIIEFEVMIRPIKALAALGEEIGNRIGPQLRLLKQAAGAPR